MSLLSYFAFLVAVVGVHAGDWYPYSDSTWSDLALICGGGSVQSPVDFPNCPSAIARPEPSVTWADQDVTMVNNGHTIVMAVKSGETNPGTMSFYVADHQKSYTLVQCHVHYGSEHTVGGTQFPFEVHCVHALVTDQEAAHYGVFGVFFQLKGGANSAYLQQWIDAGLQTHSSSVNKRLLSSANVSFNLMGEPVDEVSMRRLGSNVEKAVSNFQYDLLLRGLNLEKYFSYSGSFTTPPCTEAVDFYIFQKPVPMSQSQLDSFQAAIGWQVAGGNFRPPQPLHGRTVYGCTESEPVIDTQDWYPFKADTWANHVGDNSHTVCAGGSEQSPIDFEACAAPMSRSPLVITWAIQTTTISNNGHTVQITPTSTNPGQMSAGSTVYNLAQCHFHWPSEHKVGGRQNPFEVHCVHVKVKSPGSQESDSYGVFGLFYDYGAENSFLQTLIDQNLPTISERRLEETRGVAFDLFGNPMDVVAKRRLSTGSSSRTMSGLLNYKELYGTNELNTYWDYQGSFTTPPCTEAVTFYIMQEPAQMSESQLSAFKIAIGWTQAGGNFRPPQRLGSRIVSGCSRLRDATWQIEQAKPALSAIEWNTLIKEEVEKAIAETLKEKQGSKTATITVALAMCAIAVPLSFVTLALAGYLYKIFRVKMVKT